MYHFVYIIFESYRIHYTYLYNIKERDENTMKKKSIFVNCLVAAALLLTSAGTIQPQHFFALF